MFQHFLKKFTAIEEERGNFLKSKVEALLKTRRLETQKIYKEIEAYNLFIKQENNSTINKAIQVREQEIIKINENRLNEDKKYIQEANKTPEPQIEHKEKTEKIENINTSFLDNMNIEIVDHKRLLTNIPFSEEFVVKYVTNYHIEKSDNKNPNIFNCKRIINKRIMQVTADVEHIKEISKDIVGFTNDTNLIQVINSVIVQQGKLQVALHNESYKGYAYFFSSIYNEEIMQNFRYKVFTDPATDNQATKGVYLIYFGVLKLMKLYDEAWFLFASMMNVKPIEKSLYVMEGFLIVLCSDLMHFYGAEFPNIKHFLLESFCKHPNNKAVQTRIKTLIEKAS